MKQYLMLLLMIISLAAVSTAANAESPKNELAAFRPYMAYGASATTQEVIAVRFDRVNGKLKGKIVQREALGFEGAPLIYRDHRLYVASLRAKAPASNKLKVFRVNNGRLNSAKEFNMKHGSAYTSIDRSGRFLLAVSYFEGHADVYQLDENALPSKHRMTVFEGRNKAHSILTTRDNRFVYVPYVGENNAMFQYQFEGQTGTLTPLKPSQAKIPDGIGPRHVAFHPTKPFVFFSNEQHLGATSFRIANDGQLSVVTVCDAGELKAKKGLAAADVEVTPDGQFLFVAVRDFANGKLDAIHRYAIGPSGRLSHLGKTDADAIPWGLQMSPDHQHLLVTAAKGDTLTAYHIGKDGSLTKETSIKWGNMVRDIAVTILPAE